ncbi:Cytochrome bo(3) ubiquinol oxidase subunit 3 [Buchnera aphidicola (Eriosoma lanigerum)]|uniref:cytochrome c oxidase subunit 3 n=1 Tax=Buchnera aphidicola TaxID=9 RepID=UPI0034649C5B
MINDACVKQIKNINDYNIFNNKKILGFWLYLMSDCIIFATMFAVYEVLLINITDYINIKKIFNLTLVMIESFILLISSFSFGMSMIYFLQNNKKLIYFWLVNTFLLGFSFVSIEIYEFFHLCITQHSPQNSAFLSAYFTLIGLHGIHVIIGLLWIVVMLFQLSTLDYYTQVIYVKMKCLGLFWHFLDVIWICVLTFVYFFGVIK